MLLVRRQKRHLHVFWPIKTFATHPKKSFWKSGGRKRGGGKTAVKTEMARQMTLYTAQLTVSNIMQCLFVVILVELELLLCKAINSYLLTV